MATAGSAASGSPDPQAIPLLNGLAQSPSSSLSSAPAAPTAKKAKGKKEKPGPEENLKMVAATISQLEQARADNKDQDAEIGMSGA